MNRAEKKRLLTLGSIVAIVIILAAVGLSYVMSHIANNALDDLDDPQFIDETADLAIGKVDQTSTRNGRDEWRLTADKSTFRQSTNILDLDNVAITFFFENGNTGRLIASKGVLEVNTNDFGVYDHVKATLDDYTLATEKLNYNKAADLLTSNTRTNISTGDSYIAADYMELQVDNQVLFMEGNVKVFLTPEFIERPPEINIKN